MMPRALVVLVDGFEDVEAVTAIDILRRGGVEVVTAALGPKTAVRSAHGILMRADALFADAEKESYDVVLLPGGPGTGGLKVPPVFERLRRQKAEGRLIAAICAAPTVLVDAGVLDPGQYVTCYPTCSVDLDRPCANVPVVADGSVITGQAPGAAMLFALVVLRALLGDVVAGKVARGLVTDVL